MKETPNAGLVPHRLQVLLDAARLLNSTLELKEVTQIILEVVRAEVPVDRVSVFVVDRPRNTLHSLVAQEVEDIEISLPLGSGIAGTVAMTGEVIDVLDAYADCRFERRFDERLGYHTNDLFALPVYNRQGDIAGVLELLNRLRPITAADREFLFGISVYIGLALQNAWSHTQLRAKEQLEQQLVTLRDRLAETEQVSLTSELFNHVLNEINNPLAVAMGYAELARDLEIPTKVRTYLEKITRGIDQTATAARKFREFIDGEKQERSPVSLGGVLRQISDLRAQDWERQNIETALFLETVPPVFAHEGQMQLVVLYLVKNAEAALLQSEGKRKLRIHLSATAEQVRVEVYDSGPSRTPEVQQRLLQPPFIARSQHRSSSLGLAIAFSIVEQHNGRIQLESKDGTGNNFIIELPAFCNES